MEKMLRKAIYVIPDKEVSRRKSTMFKTWIRQYEE